MLFGKSGNIVTKKALIWAVVVLIIAQVLTLAALARKSYTTPDTSTVEWCYDHDGLIDKHGECVGYWQP